MIETEHQRQAALSAIRYWKESVSAGEQSWLAHEQALEELMKLHRQVDSYEKRTSEPLTRLLQDDIQALAVEPVERERSRGDD